MTIVRKVPPVFVSVFWLIGVAAAELSAVQLRQLPADEYIARMDRPERVVNLMVDEVVAALDLQPGEVVADIGSGSGAFSIPMARAIGPSGTLYAVDIDQDMLDFVVERARDAGLGNVRPVLGEFDDPLLPVEDVDVAFLHRTLHMIEHRQAYLNALTKYMAPDGRMVIIERGREAVTNWMWLERSHVDIWMAANSFYPAQEFEGFGNRWFVVYQRPYGDSMLPGAASDR